MGIETQWPLVLFTLFSGIGAGLLIPTGIAELADKSNEKTRSVALIVSLIMLIAGGCFSLLHLAAPHNVMSAVYNIFSFSGISMELILLGACCIVTLVFLVAVKRALGSNVLKAISIIGIIVAVLLMYFCGHGYVMPSRPAWDTEMLPIAYLGTSLAGGIFAYGVILALYKGDEGDVKIYRNVVLLGTIVCACSCAMYCIAVIADAVDESAIAFWCGLVICGIVLMLVVGVFAFLKLEPGNLMTVAIFGLVVAVIAILAVRVVMWDTSEGYLELFPLAATGSPYVSIL